jgi:phospholipid/cholesterol/gamma-HCH transport system substrate-binding protein
MVEKADTLVGEAGEVVATLNESDIEALVSSFQTLLQNINDPDGTVGKLLVDGSVYDSVDELLRDVDSLVKKIQENPKKYLKISVF